MIRHTPGRGATISERLAEHAEHHREIVERALGLLDNDAADAHGHVDDLLRAAAGHGLTPAAV